MALHNPLYGQVPVKCDIWSKKKFHWWRFFLFFFCRVHNLCLKNHNYFGFPMWIWQKLTCSVWYSGNKKGKNPIYTTQSDMCITLNIFSGLCLYVTNWMFWSNNIEITVILLMNLKFWYGTILIQAQFFNNNLKQFYFWHITVWNIIINSIFLKNEHLWIHPPTFSSISLSAVKTWPSKIHYWKWK